jgi:hypothetical protein
MQINITQDASVALAPASFITALNSAVQFLEQTFTNQITINIEVGWGEVGGDPLPSGVTGEGGPLGGSLYSYSQVQAALAANINSSADAIAVASLPASDPTGGGQFYIGGAEEKALGLPVLNPNGFDGDVGFQGDVGVATIEHEITHAMGRIAFLGTAANFGDYSVLDLFRYTGVGILSPSALNGAYFSADGGKTVINTFDSLSDPGDWAGATPDAFNAFGGPNDPISAGDLEVMDILGFALAALTTTSGRLITVTDGPQTVVGGVGDTIMGGSGSNLINALAGPETVVGGSGPVTVWGGVGDSIVGGKGAMFVDSHAAGPETIVGGAGTLNVQGAAGDSIVGGSGALTVNDNAGHAGGEKIVGGSGSMYLFDLGPHDTIIGSTGSTTFVDDTYGFGGNSRITGGSGTNGVLADGENTFIKTAAGDTVIGGSNLTLILAQSGKANVTGGPGTVTGAIAGASGINTNILGGVGDTITGGAGATLIDAMAGGMTVTGGSGAVSVEGATGDKITGGSGQMLVVDPHYTGGLSVTGGAGNLYMFNLGKQNTISGSTSGWSYINDVYLNNGAPGGGNSKITGGKGAGAVVASIGGSIGANTIVIGQTGDTITGSTGNIYIDASRGAMSVTGGSSKTNVTFPSGATASGGTAIQGGANDTIVGGSGTLQLYINSNVGAETVNLGAGHGATSLRDVNTGTAGATTSVTEFSTATDTIQSKTSVSTSGTFLGTSSVSGSNTTLTFVDGSVMTLAGVTNISAIKFTQ